MQHSTLIFFFGALVVAVTAAPAPPMDPNRAGSHGSHPHHELSEHPDSSFEKFAQDFFGKAYESTADSSHHSSEPSQHDFTGQYEYDPAGLSTLPQSSSQEPFNQYQLDVTDYTQQPQYQTAYHPEYQPDYQPQLEPQYQPEYPYQYQPQQQQQQQQEVQVDQYYPYYNQGQEQQNQALYQPVEQHYHPYLNQNIQNKEVEPSTPSRKSKVVSKAVDLLTQLRQKKPDPKSQSTGQGSGNATPRSRTQSREAAQRRRREQSPSTSTPNPQEKGKGLLTGAFSRAFNKTKPKVIIEIDDEDSEGSEDVDPDEPGYVTKMKESERKVVLKILHSSSYWNTMPALNVQAIQNITRHLARDLQSSDEKLVRSAIRTIYSRKTLYPGQQVKSSQVQQMSSSRYSDVPENQQPDNSVQENQFVADGQERFSVEDDVTLFWNGTSQEFKSTLVRYLINSNVIAEDWVEWFNNSASQKLTPKLYIDLVSSNRERVATAMTRMRARVKYGKGEWRQMFTDVEQDEVVLNVRKAMNVGDKRALVLLNSDKVAPEILKNFVVDDPTYIRTQVQLVWPTFGSRSVSKNHE